MELLMSFSIQRETSDGTLSTLDLTIEYIDQADVKAFVNDIEIELTGGVTPYTWEWLTPAQIKITPNVPNGLVAMVKRSTPMDAMYHVYDAGAVFKDETVDENFKQVLFLSQEAKEGSGVSDIYSNVNMHGYVIGNHGAAVLDGDLVTFGQYRNDSLGSGFNRVAAEAARDVAVAAKNTTVAAVAAAALSETNAAASELSAGNSASSANANRILAENAAVAAAGSLDEFTDIYLGPKAVDPTLDNDGAALLEGALYWNSTVKEMRTYNGVAWDAAYLPVGAYVTEDELANTTDPAKGVGMVGGAQRTVTTIAALAALGAGVSSVTVLHRTNISDKAGGVFDWVAGNQSANVTADPLQGVWVAPASDPTGASGAYRRVYNELNVTFFGAAPGGTVDCTAAIQAAIDFAPSRASVYVPSGIYKVSATIKISKSNITLYGDSATSSYLLRTDGGYGDTLSVMSTTPDTVAIEGVTIRDLRIQCNGDMATGAHIHLVNTAASFFENITMVDGHRGFWLEGVRTCHFTTTLILAGGTGPTARVGSAYVYIDLPRTSALENTELFFSDFNWEGPSQVIENGLVIRESDGIWFSNGHIMGAANADCYFLSSAASDQLLACFFNHVWFDGFCTRNLQISGNGGLYGLSTFTSCRFTGATSYNVISSTVTTVNGMAFIGCEFGVGALQHSVDLFSGKNYSFNACRFEQIDAAATSSTDSYIIVRASSTLEKLSVVGCTFIGDAKLQHGIQLLNINTEYYINGNSFVDFSTVVGEEVNVAVTGNKIVGQIKANTTDRTFSVVTNSTITIPAIAETVNITGAAGTIDTIIPTWEGRAVTLRANTAIQTLSEAGNIVNRTAGSYALPVGRATRLEYFSAFNDWCQV